ncbi:glycerate kinase [Paenibacillus sp. Root444D2]|uniref:glycerate kinase n=1 Tax=Paenibacillus sp. Root444D2 TaxID=1736538 RepID=UPI001F1E6EEA|nr:glycerate kinase [Paenibacillus sp. Root444D2]
MYGIELVMQSANMRKQLENADLVVTGEGRLDQQTLSGKWITDQIEQIMRLLSITQENHFNKK